MNVMYENPRLDNISNFPKPSFNELKHLMSNDSTISTVDDHIDRASINVDLNNIQHYVTILKS